MKNKIVTKLKIFFPGLITFIPVLSSAQVSPIDLNAAGTTFYDVLDYINDTLRLLNPVLFSMAFVVFFWGLSKFVLNSGNKDEIEKGKNYMFWAVIALFILVSFRVIIDFISTDLGLGGATTTPQIPQA